MADSSQYDEATLARRYAMAAELMKNSRKPVTHWAEGLANMANAALGGYEYSKADEERRAEKAAERAENYRMFGLPPPAAAAEAPTGGFQKLAALFNGGAAGIASASPGAPAPAVATQGGLPSDQASYAPPPAAGPAPTTFRPGITAPPASAPGNSNPQDRDLLIRTVIGEAGNQGPEGMAAVAHVVNNRLSSGKYGQSMPDVLFAPKQFEPWNTRRSELLSISPDSKAYRDAAAVVDRVLAGETPDATGGATHFANVPIVEQRGNASGMRWINDMRNNGTAVQIGAHTFGRPDGGTSAPPQNSAPTAAPNPFAHLPQETRERMAADMSSRNPTARAMAQALMQQHLKPTEYGFKTAGDTLYRTNPRTGAVEPIKDVGRGVQPMTAEQRKQWNVPEGMSAGVDDNGKPVFSPAGTNINLNTAQAGTKAMQAKAVEDFQAAQEGSRSAVKRSAIWDQMEQAAKGFTPGATADLKLTAKRYLKDTGFIAGEDVPDAEVFKQLQQQIAIHAQPKGQGAVSNVERELFAKAIPNITMSPEGLSRSIQISRSLDEYDRKVAQVYRDNAKKHQGIPDSVEVNEEIEKLGSPISTSDSNYLQKAASGAATGAASTVRKFNPATGKIE